MVVQQSDKYTMHVVRCHYSMDKSNTCKMNILKIYLKIVQINLLKTY